MQTYLLDNQEVKTTGRTADKLVKGRRDQEDKRIMLHEVTPVDQEHGSWKKWVNLHELFVVRDED